MGSFYIRLMHNDWITELRCDVGYGMFFYMNLYKSDINMAFILCVCPAHSAELKFDVTEPQKNIKFEKVASLLNQVDGGQFLFVHLLHGLDACSKNVCGITS